MAVPSFCFIDESGVLEKDPRQPFFAMGFLFIKDTSDLVESLTVLKAQMKEGLGKGGDDFEFKFNRVTYESVDFYKKLIDMVLSSDVRVVVFLVDKADARTDPSRYFNSVWDAYIACAKLVIKQKVKGGSTCIPIADYFSRPKWSERKYDSEMKSLRQVVNATMLESHASMLIQAVDILTGCVRYEFEKKQKGISKGGTVKMKLVKHLARKLGRTSLARSFTVTKPVKFEVWRLERK